MTIVIGIVPNPAVDDGQQSTDLLAIQGEVDARPLLSQFASMENVAPQTPF